MAGHCSSVLVPARERRIEKRAQTFSQRKFSLRWKDKAFFRFGGPSSRCASSGVESGGARTGRNGKRASQRSFAEIARPFPVFPLSTSSSSSSKVFSPQPMPSLAVRMVRRLTFPSPRASRSVCSPCAYALALWHDDHGGIKVSIFAHQPTVSSPFFLGPPGCSSTLFSAFSFSLNFFLNSVFVEIRIVEKADSQIYMTQRAARQGGDVGNPN